VAVDWQEPVVLQSYEACPLPVLTDIGPAAAASKHTNAPINHTRPSPRKHSPDGATWSDVVDIQLLLTILIMLLVLCDFDMRCLRRTLTYLLSYSFIDLERMKGWVGLVNWPAVVTRQLQVERRTAKARRPRKDALLLNHATNQRSIFRVTWPVSVFRNKWYYVANGTHSYNETLIGNHTWPMEWCYYQWPWGTLQTPTPLKM